MRAGILYRESAHTFEVEGVRIPAVLTVPSGDAEPPVWAILLVPGSLWSDPDGNYPTWNIYPHVYADLARQLAAHGYAVLRYAKHGPGTGTVVVDAAREPAHRHFETRVLVAAAALDLLRGLVPDVRRFAVAGHSEGSVVSSLLLDPASAAPVDVRALVCLSGPAVGLLDIMRDQTARMLGLPAGGDLADFDACAARVRRGESLPDGLLENLQTQMFGRIPDDGLSYIREVDAVDPAAALARVRQPVLIIQGGRDSSVVEWNGERLRVARIRAGLPTRYSFFPELTHMYKVVPPGTEPAAEFALDTESDPRVAGTIAEFLHLNA